MEGKLLTPLIIKKTEFQIFGCKASIHPPIRRYYTKINTAKPMYPYSFICYLGTIKLQYTHNSLMIIQRKLLKLLKITQIGKYQNEGLGLIQWIKGKILKDHFYPETRKYPKKLRLRKGLPLKLTKDQQDLLQYALLHDFFHTPKHQSKVYVEPPLEDEELVDRLRNHHEQTSDPLIKIFQYYDQLAARITRKIRSPIISRYNWQAKRELRKIDFKKLAQKIKEVTQQNIWNLYRYIYESKELRLLTESMNHGHTALRNHLLIIANLIVQDFDRLLNINDICTEKPLIAVPHSDDGRRTKGVGQRIRRLKNPREARKVRPL